MTKKFAEDFDQSKAYREQEPNGAYFDDGREIALLHFIYSKPDIEEIRGDPKRVLDAIDEYGHKSKYLMNVGEFKGKFVTDLIAQRRPQTMVECGGYVGYSAILFGDALRKAGGQRYYSLERNPEFAAVVLAVVDLAGLSDIVKVEVGRSDASIERLHSSGKLKHIDLMFLDHHKPAYLTDLKLSESLGLIQVGAVITADNVISPGNPPYVEYVRSTVQQKRDAVSRSQDDALNGKSGSNSHFSEKEAHLYMKRIAKEHFAESQGNPNLVYESYMLEGPEPTGEWDGIEITKCIGVE